MSLSISWIEPARLAEAVVLAGVAGRRSDREPWPRPWPTNSLGLALRPVRPASVASPTVAAGLASPAVAPPPAPAPIPTGTFGRRLEAFCDFVEASFEGCRTVFLVDETGLVVVGRNASSDLVSFASSLSALAGRLGSLVDRPATESLAVEQSDGSTLHLIRVECRIGPFVLGLTCRGPVSRRHREETRRILQELMDDEPVA